MSNLKKDCIICCENINYDLFFKCDNKECNFESCIECNKKYLLNSIHDQHCMNCKNIIDYQTFLRVFDKKWIFNKYKNHKENVLIDIEKQRFKQDIAELQIQNEINEINKLIQTEYNKYKNKIAEYETRKLELVKPTNKTKFISNFKCPIEDCNGFLNNDFKCGLCNNEICKKCYCVLSEKKHECNEEQVETFKQIKKESKTCPSCGEFISKISGCDQMFCIKCGTAFSWKTGNIEKGVIHNPHAYRFFENNPELRDIYANNLNGENNGCRDHLPSFNLIRPNIYSNNFEMIHRIYTNTAEFRQYYRDLYTNKIENEINYEMNKDYRILMINKNINEKKFKSMIHMRYKRHNCMKQIANIIRSTFDLTEMFLWEIANSSKKDKYKNLKNLNKNDFLFVGKQLHYDNEIIIKSIQELINDTNLNIQNILDLFGYKKKIILTKNLNNYPRSL